MSVNYNAIYTKVGATFATAADALADKNSLYGTELTQSVQDCYAQMTTNGILLAPITPLWDQATFTLTVVKLVSSVEAYLAAATFDGPAVIAAAGTAGWAYIPTAP